MTPPTAGDVQPSIIHKKAQNNRQAVRNRRENLRAHTLSCVLDSGERVRKEFEITDVQESMDNAFAEPGLAIETTGKTARVILARASEQSALERGLKS